MSSNSVTYSLVKTNALNCNLSNTLQEIKAKPAMIYYSQTYVARFKYTNTINVLEFFFMNCAKILVVVHK